MCVMVKLCVANGSPDPHWPGSYIRVKGCGLGARRFTVIPRSITGDELLTRSTQRAQTSAEHGMTQLVINFLSNPEDPDFGLWTPGSEA